MHVKNLHQSGTEPLPSPISLKDLFKKFYDLNSEIKQERVNRWGEFMSQKLFAEVQSKFAELKILTQNFNILDLLESLETKPTLDQILNITSRITVKKPLLTPSAPESHDLQFEHGLPRNRPSLRDQGPNPHPSHLLRSIGRLVERAPNEVPKPTPTTGAKYQSRIHTVLFQNPAQ